MIQDIKQGVVPVYAYSEEKLTDIRVYLLLLQVWLKHKKKKKNGTLQKMTKT